MQFGTWVCGQGKSLSKNKTKLQAEIIFDSGKNNRYNALNSWWTDCD